MLNWLGRIVSGGGDREVGKLRPIVEKTNALEPEFERLSDEELRAKTAEFRRRLGIDYGSAGTEGEADVATLKPRKLETLDELLPEAFAAVREASRRAIGLRHFDVQLMGGAVLRTI